MCNRRPAGHYGSLAAFRPMNGLRVVRSLLLLAISCLSLVACDLVAGGPSYSTPRQWCGDP